MTEHPHGSRQRYEAGCRCDGCRLMMIIWTRGERPPKKMSEKKIDAQPYGQFLRALLREGFTIQDVAYRTGYSKTTISNIALGVTDWIYPETANSIRALARLLPSEAIA